MPFLRGLRPSLGRSSKSSKKKRRKAGTDHLVDSNLHNVIDTLDVAESVVKTAPLIGNILEGALASSRKMLVLAEVCNLSFTAGFLL
jgi:hypothetical protein